MRLPRLAVAGVAYRYCPEKQANCWVMLQDQYCCRRKIIYLFIYLLVHVKTINIV